MKKFNISLTNVHEWALGGFALEFSRYNTMNNYSTTYLYIIKRRDNEFNIKTYSEDNIMDRNLDTIMYSDQYIRTFKFLNIEFVKEKFIASNK